MNLLGCGKAISSKEMMLLVLKVQTNHFAHLDLDLDLDIELCEEMEKSTCRYG